MHTAEFQPQGMDPVIHSALMSYLEDYSGISSRKRFVRIVKLVVLAFVCFEGKSEATELFNCFAPRLISAWTRAKNDLEYAYGAVVLAVDYAAVRVLIVTHANITFQ